MAIVACDWKKENITTTSNTSIQTKNNAFLAVNQIPLPEGYHRETYDSLSFGYWLRQVGLKKDKTVYLFNGKKKTNQKAQFSVLDISVGNKDLQQCADAVMRLRAEYLYSQHQYDHIIFKDNENTAYSFTAPFTRSHFDAYLERVFGMCGSASLSKQLNAVDNFKDIHAGDVLIRGGFPGHAAIVMDVAVNKQGKKVYLLAQSYMPAQDIHILVNPMNEGLSPWYAVDDKEKIETPEYIFTRKELKKW